MKNYVRMCRIAGRRVTLCIGDSHVGGRALLSILVGLALTVLVVDMPAASPETGTAESPMENLRTMLRNNDALEREEPFTMRPFDLSLNDKWIGNAAAYGCYREGQAPGGTGPSDDELLEDLNIIAKHWNLIRVYGADRDTRRIVRLIDEQQLPIKVVQGIWLSPENDSEEHKHANIDQVTLAIELAQRYPGVVSAISVGNETQVFWSGHKMEVGNLVRYIRAVRNHVEVPVTTADDYLYWNTEESKLVASEVDFVFTHIHPLWNGITLDRAIAWMDSTYRAMQQLHPDHTIVLAETGWATAYDSTRTGPGQQGTLVKGEVGIDAQAAFLIEVNRWIESNRIPTFLFEVFDEPWKGGGDDTGPDEIEKNWGVFNEDRTPKQSFETFLTQRRSTSK